MSNVKNQSLPFNFHIVGVHAAYKNQYIYISFYPVHIRTRFDGTRVFDIGRLPADRAVWACATHSIDGATSFSIYCIYQGNSAFSFVGVPYMIHI